MNDIRVNSKYRTDILEGEVLVTQFDRFIFWFSLLDIFFLPYFPLISVSFSVPLVALWMFLHSKELLSGKEGMAFFLVASLMIFGTVIGAVYPGDLRWETSFGTTIKRFFQYVICFGYYFFYRFYFKRRSIDFNRVLIVFAAYASVLAVFFLVVPHTYADIKMMINPVDNHTARYLAGTHYYRFNFLWTDPNNIAYLLDAIVLWFAFDNKEPFKNKLIMVALTTVVDLATASNGGIIILVAALVYVVIVQILGALANKSKIRASTLATIVVAIIIVYISVRYTPIYTIIQTELVDKLKARMMLYISTHNLSGGRFNDLSIALTYLNPLLLLVGVGKEGFTTENGHIYWIGMYGFPSYLGFMYIVFAKFKDVPWRRYVWILPMFVAFTLNIAIGEFKWLAIFFLLLAASRYDEFYKDDIINE